MIDPSTYYRETPYYSSRYEAPIEPPHPKNRFKYIIFGIIGVIFVAAVILYFATAPEESTTPTPVHTVTTTTTEGGEGGLLTTSTTMAAPSDELEIRNMQFAKKIYDDYQYTPRNSSTFRRGESVIIYFEVAGKTTKANMYGTYDINLKERVELRDPHGNLIPELSYLIDANIVDTSETKNYVKPFEYFFNLLQSDPLGTYTQTITITDKHTGQTASKSITFEVKE